MDSRDAPSPAVPQGTQLLASLMAGQTLSEFLGHSQQSQEALYHVAHTLYKEAKYEEAMRIFAYLLTNNHYERRYYTGFAACLQMQRRHADAIKYYGLASLIDLSDPRAPLHMAECYLAMNNRVLGRQSADYALTLARAQEPYANLVPRLEAMLSFIDAAGDEPASPQGAAPTAPTNTTTVAALTGPQEKIHV